MKTKSMKLLLTATALCCAVHAETVAPTIDSVDVRPLPH